MICIYKSLIVKKNVEKLKCKTVALKFIEVYLQDLNEGLKNEINHVISASPFDITDAVSSYASQDFFLQQSGGELRF